MITVNAYDRTTGAVMCSAEAEDISEALRLCRVTARVLYGARSGGLHFATPASVAFAREVLAAGGIHNLVSDDYE